MIVPVGLTPSFLSRALLHSCAQQLSLPTIRRIGSHEIQMQIDEQIYVQATAPAERLDETAKCLARPPCEDLDDEELDSALD